jgi:TolB-like protein
MRLIPILSLLALVTLTACSSVPLTRGVGNGPGDGGDEFGARHMAQVIKGQLRAREVMDQPVVVTTFVDLNNLNRSSVFGRVLAERLLNEMHLAGFTVSEIRKGRDIFIREEVGEMILSRDTRELLGRSNARAVLAGTYVATDDSIIINARMIDVNSPLILSSCSYNLRMNAKLMKLLTGESPF